MFGEGRHNTKWGVSNRHFLNRIYLTFEYSLIAKGPEAFWIDEKIKKKKDKTKPL